MESIFCRSSTRPWKSRYRFSPSSTVEAFFSIVDTTVEVAKSMKRAFNRVHIVTASCEFPLRVTPSFRHPESCVKRAWCLPPTDEKKSLGGMYSGGTFRILNRSGGLPRSQKLVEGPLEDSHTIYYASIVQKGHGT